MSIISSSFNNIKRFFFSISKESDSLVKKAMKVAQSQLRENGYAIVEAPTTSTRDLISIGQCFGKIQSHARSPHTGVVDITDQVMQHSQHSVVSKISFFPHTDGAYLNGFASLGNSFERIGPPKYILLQCVQPAEKGGETILVDGKKVLESVIETSPSLVRSLFAPKCHIYRDGFMVSSTAIFQRIAAELFTIRYSFDQDLFLERDIAKYIKKFNEQYVLNTDYQNNITLKKRDIIIVDNQRMLHGRASFEGARWLRRLWIQDRTNSRKMIRAGKNAPYFEAEGGEKTDYLDKFTSFRGIKGGIKNNESQLLASGIQLSRNFSKKIDHLLYKNL